MEQRPRSRALAAEAAANKNRVTMRVCEPNRALTRDGVAEHLGVEFLRARVDHDFDLSLWK